MRRTINSNTHWLITAQCFASKAKYEEFRVFSILAIPDLFESINMTCIYGVWTQFYRTNSCSMDVQPHYPFQPKSHREKGCSSDSVYYKGTPIRNPTISLSLSQWNKYIYPWWTFQYFREFVIICVSTIQVFL